MTSSRNFSYRSIGPVAGKGCGKLIDETGFEGVYPYPPWLGSLQEWSPIKQVLFQFL
jgi:hypothetical protein